MNRAGRTTRAQLTSSTRTAPARFKVRAQASAVLPVVSTSSTRITVLPAIDVLVADLEGAGYGLAPLERAHALERRSAAGAAKRERVGRNAQAPRQLARDQLRLIEPAHPQPRAVERHRDQQPARISLADESRHVSRHGLGDRDLSSVFRADRKSSRQLAIGDRGTRARDSGRLRQASGADGRARELQRQAAGLTPARAEKIELLPAVRAEGVHFRHDRAAAGAARRKREVEHAKRAVADGLDQHPAACCSRSASAQARRCRPTCSIPSC